jgi:hypothetical protein
MPVGANNARCHLLPRRRTEIRKNRWRANQGHDWRADERDRGGLDIAQVWTRRPGDFKYFFVIASAAQ